MESYTVPDEIKEGTSLLLLLPAFDPKKPGACRDLLSDGGWDGKAVLSILFTQSPDDYLTSWREHGSLPEQASFINVRSGSSADLFDAGRDTGLPDDTDLTVDHVSSPENLTRLGIRSTNRLETLSNGLEREVVACFDSLTALLQYVDVDKTFRFLHVLLDQFASAGVKSHFHMDPNAHDRETIETFKTEFDRVWDPTDAED